MLLPCFRKRKSAARFFALTSLSPSQPLGHQCFQLRLELRVEPAVEDGVGEGRGHGDRVAETEAQVEAALVRLREVRRNRRQRETKDY